MQFDISSLPNELRDLPVVALRVSGIGDKMVFLVQRGELDRPGEVL